MLNKKKRLLKATSHYSFTQTKCYVVFLAWRNLYMTNKMPVIANITQRVLMGAGGGSFVPSRLPLGSSIPGWANKRKSESIRTAIRYKRKASFILHRFGYKVIRFFCFHNSNPFFQQQKSVNQLIPLPKWKTTAPRGIWIAPFESKKQSQLEKPIVRVYP